MQFKMPDDFTDKIARLADKTDEIVPKVLEVGGKVVLGAVRQGLHAALSGHSTGELEAALGLSPARLDRDGNPNVKVGFAEKRSDGKSNAMLASVLEHGKHGQPPRPFLKAAKAASRVPATDAMMRKLGEEIGNI